MTMTLSRRSLFRAATAAPLVAAAARPTSLFAASAAAEPPLFGPADGVALLSRNENPYGPAPSAMKAMYDWAAKGCYYAEGGAQRLSAMIAEKFGVDRNMVVLGSGSTEVLSAAALAWKDKGAIVTPDLFWDTTVGYAERKGAKVIRVPLTATMDTDLDAMAAAVTPDVKMVHICNPNNPTGVLIDNAKLRAFIAKVSPKATVLVDEAYNELLDFPEQNSVVDLVKKGENVIVVRTFSKIYGMAGLRVGYAIAAPQVVEEVRGYEMSMGSNTAGLAAAIGSFNDTAFTNYSKAKVTEARQMIEAAVKKAGLTALPSQTNFVFVKVPDANKLRTAMAERQIMIRGAYGKWSDWSRVSCGKIEDVERYAAALPQIMQA
ncbi:pyridoxal phosphate-dependent aminotransferase [Sphingomonas sp. CJ99]